MKRILNLITISLLLSVVCSCAQKNKNAGIGPHFNFGTAVTPSGNSLYVDSKGLILNGEHILPVSGEIHFSRVREQDWKRELQKMKTGGLDMIAAYVFWNHHEEIEGQYNWTGNKNLRKFIQLCKECDLMVTLRIGPFCHGEVYLGGIPEWMVDKSMADPANYALRTLAPGFIAGITRMYNEIGKQVEGLLWKDGGPIVGVQVDNESSGPWPYLAALKQAAIDAGLDVPYYTRTGWPRLQGPEVFGELLPLQGGYADGFWDRSLNDMPGDYRGGFRFTGTRMSSVIATEVFGTSQDTKNREEDLKYPFLTCELGGGMIPSYYRRVHMFNEDALALAICKVGSGSSLPGYYMYHGGTNDYNPNHSMAELQNSKYTNWNDLPYMTYDYQAPLNEIGQPNGSYHMLRLFHQMLRDWGKDIAVMDNKVERTGVRSAVMSNGTESFVFVNNYERLGSLGERTLNFAGKEITVPEGRSFCFVSGLKLGKLEIDWATAQPFCKTGKSIWFAAIDGIEPQLQLNGEIFTPEPDKPFKVKGINIVVMSPEKALQAYKVGNDVKFSDGILYKDGKKLMKEVWVYGDDVPATQTKEAGPLRNIPIGVSGVPEQPSNEDFAQAAEWTLDIPSVPDPENWFLEFSYRGDVARVYADGILVQDNFWNGRTMQLRMTDVMGKDTKLCILPMPKDIPVYLQANQKKTLSEAPGDYMLALDGVKLLHRETSTF